MFVEGKEYWTSVRRFEGVYEVSSEGRIRRLWCRIGVKEIFPSYKRGSKYKRITLCADNRRENPIFHRLIAESFIPNPNNYDQVNHLNGNKKQ